MIRTTLLFFCICCFSFSSFGQNRTLSSNNYNLLNNNFNNSYDSKLKNSRINDNFSGLRITGYSSRIPHLPDAVAIIAADKIMAVTYAIPFRVVEDYKAFVEAINEQIDLYQNLRNSIVEAYNRQDDNGRKAMEANGYRKILANYDTKINNYLNVINAAYSGLQSGQLIFKDFPPISIRADVRYIDPIVSVPLMKGVYMDGTAGGYSALMDFIPFDAIENIPKSQSILIFRK